MAPTTNLETLKVVVAGRVPLLTSRNRPRDLNASPTSLWLVFGGVATSAVRDIDLWGPDMPRLANSPSTRASRHRDRAGRRFAASSEAAMTEVA